VLIVFSVYTTVGATFEQSSTKTRSGFSGIALQLTLISVVKAVVCSRTGSIFNINKLETL
jgi:hypothetical protein